MDTLELYQSAYEYELTRRDQLNSRFSGMFAVIAILVGATTFFLNNIGRLSPFPRVTCLILLMVTALCLAYTLYAVGRALFIVRYRHVARLDRIDRYLTDLKDYNEASATLNDPLIELDAELDRFLREQYLDSTVANVAHSGRKTDHSGS